MNACGYEVDEETLEQRRILIVALILNATMFIVGFTAGVIAESTGLIADSLDMLTDALAFGIGLIAIRRSPVFKSQAARLTGTILLLLGLGVLFDVLRRSIFGANPESAVMMSIAAIALGVNSTVLYLLGKYRTGEVHLRATWIFTKVDVIANIAVIFAGLLVKLTRHGWIDLVVGAAIGAYVVKEALEILASARSARKSAVI